jgi:FAD/FMN-containing dehydrogenase
MAEEFQSLGRVITSDEPGYAQACQEWNARFTPQPEEIVYCQSAQDVSAALRSALDRGLPFRARCGGHSYEGFSMVDAGVVIDVSDLSAISVNEDRTVAVIGSGGRLKDIYSKLWQVGVTIPGGTCPPVGISGLTLGGGLGMLVRSRGLLQDSLLAIEMVDAQGRILTADSSNNSDLFWACKGGGGGNFGIVTSLTFRVEPISYVTVFSITWKWSDFAAALDAWQKWAPDSDERISVLFVLLPETAGVITSFGEFVGTSEELRPMLDPVLNAGQPTQISIQTMTYIQAVDTIATMEGDASTTTTNRVKAATSFAAETLDAQAIQTLQEWMAKAPAGAAPVIYALGGAISRVAPQDTAFVHRNARLLLAFQSNWTNASEDQANVEWIEGIHQAMQPFTTGGAYVNIPDRKLENWLYAYYGDNLPKLMEVKRRYDPDNVFNFEQSIPVSLTPDEARSMKLPESMITKLTS